MEGRNISVHQFIELPVVSDQSTRNDRPLKARHVALWLGMAAMFVLVLGALAVTILLSLPAKLIKAAGIGAPVRTAAPRTA